MDCSPVCYLERGVDPTDQCVQDVHVVMCVQQDEGQEGLEEDGLRDGAQEQIQVRSGGHHLLHCQLHTHIIVHVNMHVIKKTTNLHAS